MTPVEDASWPPCPDHGERHWCSYTAHYLAENKDADIIVPGLRYCVPMFPDYNLYAQVAIDPAEIAPGIAYLSLVISKPFAPDDEDLIEMGLWTQGEGRLVMYRTIESMIEFGHDDKVCNYLKHSFPQEMQLQEEIKRDENGVAKRANTFALYYHGRCIVCHRNEDTVAVDPEQSWTASSFGVNPEDFKGRGGAPQTGRQQRTREALNNRFGNRVTDQYGNNIPLPFRGVSRAN